MTFLISRPKVVPGFGMPSLPLLLRNYHRALGYTFLASMTELPLDSLPMPFQLGQWHVPDAQVKNFLSLAAVLTYKILWVGGINDLRGVLSNVRLFRSMVVVPPSSIGP